MNGGKVIYHFEGDTKDLEQKAKGIGSTVKGALSGVAGTVGGVFATAFATATAMVTTMTKKAIDSYADLEQNIGGVETLFKDSADRVIENSKKAYKTAGMSANQYMETVTSFSASLLQSLGGDTEKATEYADQAIIDMSDNANKMGTSMEMIQNAYQGFAKQNYTMLDNLKLGYGGTKTEMERLLADAEKISGIHYDISSYADITQAIHVIQENMGITGTTAKEAEQTITGSINALKGAFNNFLNGSGGIDEVVNSAVTVVGNLSNAFIKIVPQLTDGLVKAVDKLLPQIPNLIKKLLPTFLKAILDLTKGIASELPSFIQTIISSVIEVVNSLAQELPTLLPVIIDALINGLLTYLDNIDEVVECGLKLILGLIQGIITALPTLVEKGPEILEKLIFGLISSIGMIIEYAPQIILALVQGLDSAFNKLDEVGKQVISKLWEGIKSMFGSLWSWAKQIPSNIINSIKADIGGMRDVGADMIRGLWEGIKSVKDWIWRKISGFFSGIVNKVKDFFKIGSPSKLFADDIGQWLPKGLAVGIEANTNSVQKAIDDMNDIVTGSFNLQPDITSLGSSYSPETTVIVNNNMKFDPLGQVVSNIKTYSGGAKNDFNYGGGIA